MDLKTQLETTLGTAYTIERELGGGGMSRVFLAEETRFRRRVVIKVLSPELAAGISAERFEREITLAAQLQQANIVPVLAAGEVEGLPYFTMPFVEGESLRWRMQRSRLHVTETVAVLRDIARALAYAHQHGIVHRDIKPENVLLSGGAAVVTDFGIAKAVQAAKTAAPGGTLTVVGTSLGTPAYMAPEQAAGDAVDERADLYAWGIVAYELLAGRHPFHGRTTAQQLLAAHIAEQPVPLATVEPSVPPSLAELVMRALQKDPALRPQSAREIAQALDGPVMTSGEVRPLTKAEAALIERGDARRVRPTVVAVGVVLAAMLAVGVYVARQNMSQLSRGAAAGAATANRVAVAPFENRSAMPALADVSGLAQDRISARLAETQVGSLVPGMEGTAAAEALARARELRADLLVTGAVYRDGDSVQARADIVDVSSGRLLRTVGPVSGAVVRPAGAIDGLRERIVGTIGVVTDPVLSDVIPAVTAQTPTYAAFREFAAGEDRSRAGQWAAALPHYTAAFRLDSTFTFAAVRAARGFYNTQRCDKADSLAASLVVRRDRLSEYERAVLDRTTARCRGDWIDALDAARRASALVPTSTDARSVYGVSALYLYRAEEGLRALQWADSASGSSDETEKFYITLALHLLGRHAEERRVADDAARKWPGTALSYRMLSKAAAAQGDTATAERLADEIASLPIGGAVEPRVLLLPAALELRRHGHPRSGQRVLERLADYLDGVPPTGRTVGYWHDRGDAYYILGKWTEALAAIDSADARFRTLSREDRLAQGRVEYYSLALRGRIAARQGRIAEAEAIQRTLLSRSGPYLRGWPTRHAAEIAGALGRRDEVIRLLRRSMQQGQMSADEYLDALPDFDAFKDDPAFVALFAPRG